MMNAKDMHVQGPQINQFNNLAPHAIPRSAFKRDFTRRTTFNQDYLVPIFLDEILPGDQVKIRMTALTRMSTPIKPLMDNLYQETFWFFVPNRLVWDHWEAFQGQQLSPGGPTNYLIPTLDETKAPLSTTGFLNQSIYDYFGLPTLVNGISQISCLFNRAYDLIWNEWFRDENLQNSLAINKGDGPDNPAIYDLRKRNNRKDYFMSMLPWPQKGDPVTIPLGGYAPVIGTGAPIKLKGLGPGGTANMQYGTTVGLTTSAPFANGEAIGLYDVAPTGLQADIGAVNPITINLLRQAALYQQILELDARGGTRYVESIFSRFGVVSPDFRLQRPELIGQGSNRINIYAVPQTAPTTTGQTPQGNLAAFGVSQIHGDHGCHYAATEHGMLIGLMNVRADLTYQQGVPKMFARRTRLDFYEPLLNGLGEQAVLKQELMAVGNSTDKETGGYQERFSEYRFKNSEITGKFRSNDPQTLQVWHLSINYASYPGLNSAFITQATPMARVLAVNTEPSFLSDISFDYLHVRPMPMRSNPGIDRL